MNNRNFTAIVGLLVILGIGVWALGAAAWEWVEPILAGWVGW